MNQTTTSKSPDPLKKTTNFSHFHLELCVVRISKNLKTANVDKNLNKSSNFIQKIYDTPQKFFLKVASALDSNDH